MRTPDTIRRAWGRLTGGVRTRLVTWNRGNGSKAAMREFVRKLKPDVVAFQEMSDALHFLPLLRELGYVVIVGEPDGAPATPMAVKASRFEIRRRIVHKLVDKDAAKSVHKDKFLVGALLYDKITRQRVAVAGLHAPYNQDEEEAARRAAEAAYREAFRFLGRFGAAALAFLGGDFNRVWDKIPAPAGWKCSQRLQPVVTHGKGWKPDMWWMRNHTALEFLRAFAVRGPDLGDHRPLVVDVKIRVKKKESR